MLAGVSEWGVYGGVVEVGYGWEWDDERGELRTYLDW